MSFVFKDNIYVGKSQRKRGGFVDEERNVTLVGHSRNSSGIQYYYFIFQDEIFELSKREFHENGKTIYEFSVLSRVRSLPIFQENIDDIRVLIKEAVLAEQEWLNAQLPKPFEFSPDRYIFQFTF